MKIYSLMPIVDEGSRFLILGTAPSEMSLKKRQYYANPRNQFWAILEGAYDEHAGQEYQDRIAFLKSKYIALWDVLESCERISSADNQITNPVPNDFAQLLAHHPSLKLILFNGKKAEAYFNKLVKESQSLGSLVGFKVLPSTSPQNRRARQSKITEWKAAFLWT